MTMNHGPDLATLARRVSALQADPHTREVLDAISENMTQLQAQRDELVAALRHAETAMAASPQSPWIAHSLTMVRAALAKVQP